MLSSPPPASSKAGIVAEETLLDDWFTVRRYTVEHTPARGGPAERLSRLSMYRGDRVVALLHNQAADTVVMVRQLRVPPLSRGDCDGWVAEAPGGLAEGDSEMAAISREIEEETGYRVTGLTRSVTVYMAPHLTSERTHLFFGECHGPKVGQGGGNSAEGEHVLVEEWPSAAALETLLHEDVIDGKSLLLLLLKERLSAR